MSSELAEVIETAAIGALEAIMPAPLASLIAQGLGELAETIAASKSPEDALARAKQNVLADAEDAAAVGAADAILKGEKQ
jgi:hypothetical protein